jgi:NOL1/NOP2/fmu family ribosome biogenesis protein
MGCVNTVVVNLDTAVLAETYPSEFDVVLCDAPCSGEGMFRKNSLAVDEWSEENVEMCAERQREILTNVEKCVAAQGFLIYSTCTFSLEENEMNVAWFLDKHPDFELCEVTDGLKQVTSDGICFDGCLYDMTRTRRFYPHVSDGEGQFIAVMRRRGDALCKNEPTAKQKCKKGGAQRPDKQEVEAIAAAKEFIDENFVKGSFDGELYEFIYLNEKVYIKPKIALPRYSVFAAGVCAGELAGRRFVPHHQLFSAYGNCFARKVLLGGETVQASQYLRGLEISVEGFESFCGKADGWAAVLIDGCAVGGGKISSGVCKNHYPKGLRNQQ